MIHLKIWNPFVENVIYGNTKNLNDPTRELHQKAAEMLRMVQEKMGLQMIIVTQIGEIADIADRVFEVTISNEVSKVEVL